MNHNNLLTSSQYGFRPNHATEYAAMELVDKTMSDIDKGKIPLSIFLDLSKAFDTLDHTILLKNSTTTELEAFISTGFLAILVTGYSM